MTDIETLLWWKNYADAARQRLKATTCPNERASLQAIGIVTGNEIVRLGRRAAATAKATLARLDAEEVCS